MDETKKYSRVVWDYIKKLAYMPSRQDREKLFTNNENRERVELWDYFFRIKPTDIGELQRAALKEAKASFRDKSKECKEEVNRISAEVVTIKNNIFNKALQWMLAGNFAIGIVAFIAARIIVFPETSAFQSKKLFVLALYLFLMILLFVFVFMDYSYGTERKEANKLAENLEKTKEIHRKKADNVKKQIKILARQVKDLKKQAPYALKLSNKPQKYFTDRVARTWLRKEIQGMVGVEDDHEFRVELERRISELNNYDLRVSLDRSFENMTILPDTEFRVVLEREAREFRELSGQEVREWFDRDLEMIKRKARKEVATNRVLVPLKSDDGLAAENPITVVGPGELQSSIPQPFDPAFDEDLYKHLSARRAYSRKTKSENKDIVEVLYGVYFIQLVFIAENMLITYSFFYDFIDNKIRARHITEQYYKDVVGLQITNEYRKLASFEKDSKPIYIEEAPTFTISLSSGEKHQVTFVNRDYFSKIKKSVNLNDDGVNKITWVERSTQDANNAIAALRKQLRAHKTI